MGMSNDKRHQIFENYDTTMLNPPFRMLRFRKCDKGIPSRFPDIEPVFSICAP